MKNNLRYLIYLLALGLVILSFPLIKAKTAIFANTAWYQYFNMPFFIVFVLFVVCSYELFYRYSKKIDYLLSKNKKQIFWILFALLILINLIIQIFAPIMGDQVIHAHSSYLISKGKIPYIEFFEHHNPLYWYAMAPILLFFPNLTGTYLMIFVDSLMLILVCAILFQMSKKLFSEDFAMIAVILYLSSRNVLLLNEIRPDVLAGLFLVASLYFILNYRKTSDYIKSGILIGLSILTLQKTALYFVGLLPIFILFEKGIKNKIKNLFIYIVSSLIPSAIFILYLLFVSGIEGVKSYLYLSYHMNAIINLFSTSATMLITYLVANSFHIVVGIIGAILLLKKEFKKIQYILILNCAIFVYLLFIKLRVLPQDWLMFGPIFAISGAYTITFLRSKIKSKSSISIMYWILTIVLISQLLLSINVLAQKDDRSEIQYYLDNFAGNKTNCLFIFNEDFNYHWFAINNMTTDYLKKYNINKTYLDVSEMIKQNAPVLCHSMQGFGYDYSATIRERDELLRNNYTNRRLDIYVKS